MNKSPPPDNDDLAFFRAAMKDVKRIKSSDTRRIKRKKNTFTVNEAKPLKKEDDASHSDFSLFDPVELTIGAEDKLFFSRPGLQNKRIKQLIRGDIHSSDYLDLHQMTVEQARLAVLNFLLNSREQNYRCVRIIHGKGRLAQSGAKLKNYVNCWLEQIPWILAFSSAQPRDGGTGALYVLLRKIR